MCLLTVSATGSWPKMPKILSGGGWGLFVFHKSSLLYYWSWFYHEGRLCTAYREKLKEERDLSGHSVTYSFCGMAASGLFRKMLEHNRMSILHNRYSYTGYIKNSLAPSALTFRGLYLITKLFICELNLDIACDISITVAFDAVDIKLRFDFNVGHVSFQTGQ